MGLKTKFRNWLSADGKIAKLGVGKAEKNTTANSRRATVALPDLDDLRTRFPDISTQWLETFRTVSALTMTSAERVFAVCQAVSHVCKRGIAGDFVECGVWRGGSSMAMVLTLQQWQQQHPRHAPGQLWLYDTFEGMSNPSDSDIDCFGNAAEQLLAADTSDRLAANSIWCQASLADVKNNFRSIGFPEQQLRCIVGKVEQTLPDAVPEKISVLRLDTDWYQSTWHELIHLYPRLQSGGVLIVDDYGHWQGCREAVDQYIAEYAPDLFLHRIDYTGRMAVKP